MKKVLIITYYWPPMGGGGVQRWLKFSKYLRDFGWEPVIYTPENADVSNEDHGLLKEVPEGIEVHRLPIWEPFDLYKRVMGKGGNEKIQPGFLQESKSNSALQKLSVWIRGNLFIPDAKKFWIKPSVKYLSSMLPEQGISYIISTGPPHTNHLIALALRKKLGVKWLADFRDPWTNIDYYEKLMLTRSADSKHHRMEKEVLTTADEVVTVSWSWAKDFHQLTGRTPKVVTNGYDPQDFRQDEPYKKGNQLIITHIGSLNKDRNPEAFWQAVSRVLNSKAIGASDLRIRLIGPTDVSAFESVKKNGLTAVVEHLQHMPHKEVLDYLMKSDIQLLPLNDTPNIDGVIPGKLYEYLASKRPILCVGKPTGDSSRIIRETGAGSTFDFNDVAGIVEFLTERITQWKENGIPANSPAIEVFSRQRLAGAMADLLNAM